MLGRSLADHGLVAAGSVAAETVAGTVEDFDIAASFASVLVAEIAGDFASVLAGIEQRMQG